MALIHTSGPADQRGYAGFIEQAKSLDAITVRYEDLARHQIDAVRDYLGAEVNAASKLGEDTAKAGEILVTGAVAHACSATGKVTFELLPEAPPGAEQAFRVLYPSV